MDNENPFEYRTGEVDKDAFVMTGATPAVQLTRKGTIRLLENLQKNITDLKLSEKLHVDKPSYAKVVLSGQRQDVPRHQTSNILKQHQSDRQRGCYNSAEKNHTFGDCRYRQRIRCLQCNKMGHKAKFCYTRI